MPRSAHIRCLALQLSQSRACFAGCGNHVEQGRPVMRIVDVMTRNPQPVSPDATLQDAARLMDDLNVGALPVCEGDRLVGILTDRDIVVRSTSAGHDPRATKVAEAMTTEVHACFLDTSVHEAMGMMESLQHPARAGARRRPPPGRHRLARRSRHRAAGRRRRHARKNLATVAPRPVAERPARCF